MAWVVMVIGLSLQPTFLGPYSDHADCARRRDHVNIVYGDMVRAGCVQLDEAERLGYIKE